MTLLQSVYPIELARLSEQAASVASETDLELTVDSVFIRDDRMIAAYKASDGRTSTMVYFSTPIDKPKRKTWWRGSAA